MKCILMEDIKIKIPEGYEIDKEKSIINLEKNIVDIKLKKKIERWRDNIKAIITGYYISQDISDINKVFDLPNNKTNYNVFATEKQAKSALAMARISQIMANDKRFGGAITEREWILDMNSKYIIRRVANHVEADVFVSHYYFLAFHTEKQCKLFMKENMDLIKDYFMFD